MSLQESQSVFDATGQMSHFERKVRDRFRRVFSRCGLRLLDRSGQSPLDFSEEDGQLELAHVSVRFVIEEFHVSRV